MDHTLVIGIAGVTSYIIFKRTETISSINLLILLFFVPVLLAIVPVPSRVLEPRYVDSQEIRVIMSFIGYYATILSCIVLYRLSPWHPLAKYPGPLICKITKLKGAVVGRGGKQYLYYRDLHRKYGDVVRIGPNELSFLNANVINPILGQSGQNYVPRGPYFDGRFPETQKIYPIGALRDAKEHHRRRIPWSKAFSTNALKEYEILVKGKTEVLAEKLGSITGKETKVVQMSEWLSYYTYDMMTAFVFSGGSNMLEEGDTKGLLQDIRVGHVTMMFMSHVPWLGRLCYRLPSRLFSGLNAFRKNSHERAMKRKAEGSKLKDLYYYLLDEGNPDAQIPEAQVISDGSSAVLGGSDTTSSTMILICHFLTTRPKVYERLQQEIDASGEGWNDSSVLAKMPYLNAVINETLRLWPPVLNGSPRGIPASAPGRMIGDSYVPPGTNLIIPTYSVQRDARNFSPLPDEFVPERWLNETDRIRFEPGIFQGSENYKHDVQAFLPFSAGPTNCVGKNLAMLEMRMVLSMLVKRFEMEWVGDKKRDFEETVTDYFTMQMGNLPVRLRERVSI